MGAVTAISLARGKPGRIILAGRTEAKIQPVVAEIRSISPETQVDFVKLDLGDQSSVRNAAAKIKDLSPTIDVLINNAGIMAVKDYQTTPDGIELQFGTNYIGHFLLTNLLLPQILAAGKTARIVNITSNGYTLGGVRFDDYNFGEGQDYNPWLAYAQSKSALLLFTMQLAKTLNKEGTTAFAVTPGLILETNLQADVAPELFQLGIETYQKVYEGREMPPLEKPKPLAASDSTILVAALDPSLEADSGAYLQNCTIERNIEAHAKDEKLAQQLWNLSNKLVGEQFHA